MRPKLIFLFLFLIIIKQGFALGVAQDFLKNNTLLVPYDKDAYFNIYIQNKDAADLFVKVDVSGDIPVEIIDEKEAYNISGKSYNNKVTFKISPEKYTKIGDKYSITYSVYPSSSKEYPGQIGLTMKITNSFDVLITDKAKEEAPQPKKQNNTYFTLLVFLGVLILGFIIWNRSYIFSKKLFEKKEKK